MPERAVSTQHSIGGQTKNSAWYNRMIANMKPLPVEGEDLEKSLRDKSTSSGETVHDNRYETRSVSSLSSCFLPSLTSSSTLFSLTSGEDDAGPALAYRQSQHID